MLQRMTAIGLISGTSMDGIDVALIETDGETAVQAGSFASYGYDPDLRRRIAEVVHDPAKAEHDPLMELDNAVTDAHAAAVERFLAENKIAPGTVDVIGLHGQTILHRVERRFTRQLGDGERFARRLGIDVVSRFRHADVAAGGQGAPSCRSTTPPWRVRFARPLVVLNLGGVANVTYIDGAAMGGISSPSTPARRTRCSTTGRCATPGRPAMSTASWR